MNSLGFCIFTTTLYKHRYESVLNSWGKDTANLNIFTSKHSLIQDSRTIPLDVKDDYSNITNKLFYALKYLFNKAPTTWYFLCGDDNFVYVEHLQNYIATLDTRKPIMVSGSFSNISSQIKSEFKQLYQIYKIPDGGSGILINHVLLSLIINRFDTFLTFWHDQFTNHTTHSLVYACDAALGIIAQKYTTVELISHSSLHRFPPHYYPLYLPHQGLIHKSSKPFTFHYLKPHHLLVLHRNMKKNRFNLKEGFLKHLFYFIYNIINKALVFIGLRCLFWNTRKVKQPIKRV